MSDKSISELLADKGLRHVRDEHTARDYCHSIIEGKNLIGRFDAHQAANLVKSLESEETIRAAIDSRRHVAETGEEHAFVCWLENRLIKLQRETYKRDVMTAVQSSGLRWVSYNREQTEIVNMCMALKRPVANAASLILRLYTPEPRTAAGSLD